MMTYEFPVDTRRLFNVYKTSIRLRRRRTDVLYTLKRRRVSTEFEISRWESDGESLSMPTEDLHDWNFGRPSLETELY